MTIQGVFLGNTDWGESVSELMIVKKNNYKKLYTVLPCWGVFTFCTCCKILICIVFLLLVLSGLLGNCCWLTVCIVVVVLCVLLSYVYLFTVWALLLFYFRCRTAG